MSQPPRQPTGRPPIPPVGRTAPRRQRPTARQRTRPVHGSRGPRERVAGDAMQVPLEMAPIGGLFQPPEHPVPEPDRRRRLRRPFRGGMHLTPSLLNDPDFRMLWMSRLIGQTGQGALLYAMLILVVDLSDRSIFTSLFVLCSIIPSILFGLPAGVVVDAVPRRTLLTMLNLLRFVFMLFIVSTAEPSLGDVFAATLGIWIIHQFYSPGEASLLATLVPRDRYTTAQSLFNLALTISQAAGLVLVAPVLLLVGGPRLVFAFAGLAFLVASAMTYLLPPVDAGRRRQVRARRPLRDTLGEGWRFARGDRQTFEAISIDILVGIGMSALVVIVPFYLERVLGTAKENTVFVFAPAALGLVLGLRMAPVFGRIIGERRSAILSLFGFALCVGSLGFVDQVFTFLDVTLRLPLTRIADALSISPLILVAMLMSIPAGFTSAVVNVAARSILLQRAPDQVRGQVIATQGLMGNLGALIPTLLAGVATDIFGVKPIAVAIALAIMLCALGASVWVRRPAVPVETASLA